MQQATTTEVADLVLFLLVDAIERGKVYVGGCLINIDVVVIGPENAENQEQLAGG